MLQSITKKIEKEGKEGEDLFEKFMCECKTQSSTLQKQIDAAATKGSDTAAALASSQAQQKQTLQDIVDAKKSRAAAKEMVASATGIRAKEAKDFAAMKADSTSNIEAMGKALAAIKSGVGAAFVQTDAAQTLRALIINKQDLFSGSDRDDLTEFLQGGTSSSSEFSGEIIGMLAQLKEEWEKDLADASTAEADAIKTFEQLVDAKTKEQVALQASIEEKMTRLGELGVANAEMANAGGDTGDAMADDQKLLADLGKSCAAREKEWEAEKRSRAEELLALADTIRMLNDDDALDLFKKALPGASSLLQMQTSESALKNRALALLKAAQQKHHKSTKLDFIALALHGKRKGFDKVLILIDRMVGQLGEEQIMDDSKKMYCEKEFDTADDEKKSLERKVADATTAIMDAKESLATLVEEIKTTKATIQGSDKAVAEATGQRQEENEAFKTLMTENTAALELIKMAKNRMNKFYNPSLYEAPPKRELSREDRIAVNMGGTAPPTPAPGGIAGTGIMALVQVHDEVAKKTQESAGVIAMMDLLLKDLNSQMQVAETDEKNAQSDYEQAMGDAKETRTADAKLLGEKMSAKAETDSALEGHTEDKMSAAKELMGNGEYIASLHADCDWLLQKYDQRKEARADEVDAMKKAKDVLNGADYSLLEVKRSTFLSK
jgi:septal ring factor EnvC (AmiA/AmiB activator)